MNRSARSLLSVSVLAPVVAAFAVTAAPANAAPGPSTTVLYETAAAAAPVTSTLPEPVVQTAGPAAEVATVAVDEVLGAAEASPGLRSADARRCKLNPGKTVNSHAGTSLPDTELPSVGQSPVGGLPQGDCFATGRRSTGTAGTNPLPVSPDAAGEVPGTLLKDAGKVGSAVRNSKLGGLPGVDTALPAGRSAAPPVGQRAALPVGQGDALPVSVADVPSTLGSGPGLPNVPSALGSARPGGLPVGSTLFPPAGRQARPGPSDDVLGQVNGTVNQVGADIDQTEDGVGSVVEVLKTRDRVANPVDGPLSMPDAPGLGLPEVPGLA